VPQRPVRKATFTLRAGHGADGRFEADALGFEEFGERGEVRYFEADVIERAAFGGGCKKQESPGEIDWCFYVF
jgi:hypothetical protein